MSELAKETIKCPACKKELTTGKTTGFGSEKPIKCPSCKEQSPLGEWRKRPEALMQELASENSPGSLVATATTIPLMQSTLAKAAIAAAAIAILVSVFYLWTHKEEPISQEPVVATDLESEQTTVPVELPLVLDEIHGEAETAIYLFALADFGEPSLVTKTSTSPYRDVLADLSTVYGHTPAEVGNATFATVQQLEDSNVTFQHLDVLNAMRDFQAENNSSLSELLAAYSVFRIKGASHPDAVRQIKALLGELSESPSTP